MPRGLWPLFALASLFLFSLHTHAAEPKKKKASSGPVFGSPTPRTGALRGTVYRLPKETSWLPELKRLKPVGLLYTTALNYPLQRYGDEWFAIEYEGTFHVTKPGKYVFHLTSDDGAQLYIDGKRILNNDGVHGDDHTEENAVRLEAGPHHFRLPYFQGPVPNIALILEVQPPGGKKRVFDMDDFGPPQSAITQEDRPVLKRK